MSTYGSNLITYVQTYIIFFVADFDERFFESHVLSCYNTMVGNFVGARISTDHLNYHSEYMYYCDQKILDTNVIVVLYILKRPLCINNLNFENVNVRFTEKIFKKL
jgi:hypothetical protein